MHCTATIQIAKLLCTSEDTFERREENLCFRLSGKLLLIKSSNLIQNYVASTHAPSRHCRPAFTGRFCGFLCELDYLIPCKNGNSHCCLGFYSAFCVFHCFRCFSACRTAKIRVPGGINLRHNHWCSIRCCRSRPCGFYSIYFSVPALCVLIAAQ